MIGYLKGQVLNIQDNVALIENGGIGYEVVCSSSALNLLSKSGEGAIYTYLAVREDGISLYGFSSLSEKDMFLKLISVSGVGAKMGITVLSSMTVKELCTLIATANVKGLSTVKGLGKKTAERIILELREKIGLDGVELFDQKQAPTVKKEERKVNKEALSALTHFGFTAKECTDLLLEGEEKGITEPSKLVEYVLKNI